MTLERGALLNNRYRIVEILGQGGMGAVYRAVDENLGINVAVKENLYLADEFARQFRREATILASLRHPNLPRVADHFGIESQGQYLVMDYIEGEDLRQRMERLGNLPEEDVILIGIAICDALAYLHSRKPPVVHRDIKPGNVKINPEGQIYLVDFGLAKIMEDQQATSTGARAMTPGYSPPEQYGMGHTDARTDIYSLAATLYAALTGLVPEDGLARATGNADLTPLRKIDSRINRKVAATIEHGLAIQADDRYQTAEEFKNALSDASSSAHHSREEITVAPPPLASISGLIPRDSEPPSASEIVAEVSEISPAIFPPDHPWRRGSNWLALLILIFLLLGSAALFLKPPNGTPLINNAFGYINPTSTPTLTPTSMQEAVDQIDTCLTDECLFPTKFQFTDTATPTATTVPTSTATLIPTSVPTSIGGGQGEIAFVSDRTGSDQIWIMDASGGSLQQVTNIPDGACQPSWSPDGQSLVFISPCDSKEEIYERTSMYIISRDGSNLTPLSTSPEGDFDPSWSPDGERIAFTSLRNGKTHIYIMSLADDSVRQLTNAPFMDLQPSWSPSGAQLLFVRYRSSAEIRIISDNGENEIKFTTSGTLNDYWPLWAPDNEVIYFCQVQTGMSIPWLMGMRYEDRESTKEFRVTATGETSIGPVGEPDISPDGYWFVYESWPEGDNHDIYRMTVNGANIQRLTSDRANDYQPVWNPNS